MYFEEYQDFDSSLDILFNMALVPEFLRPAAGSLGVSLAMGVSEIVRRSTKWWLNGWLMQLDRQQLKEFLANLEIDPDQQIGALRDTPSFKQEIVLISGFLDKSGGMYIKSKKRGWHIVNESHRVLQELQKLGLEWVKEVHVLEAQRVAKLAWNVVK
jgi:hypothetical protein